MTKTRHVAIKYRCCVDVSQVEEGLVLNSTVVVPGEGVAKGRATEQPVQAAG